MTRWVITMCSQRSTAAGHAVRPCWASRFVVAGGEVDELRGQDGVVGQRSPHRAPSCQPQRGSASAEDDAIVLMLAAAVAAGAQTGVLTTERGLRNRVRSPVSARIIAAQTGVSPAIEVTRSVSPNSSRTTTSLTSPPPSARPSSKKIIVLVRDLVARGRAAGIIVVAATQRPSADIIPTSLRDLFGYWWAFRCTTDASSDVIVGHGWASQDYSSAKIDAPARGVGWLIAEGGSPRWMKAACLSDDHAARIARARHAATHPRGHQRGRGGFCMSTLALYMQRPAHDALTVAGTPASPAIP